MITLEAGQTLQGVAGTATAVTYTVVGDTLTGSTDAFKVIAQGQLPSSVGLLYTATGVTALIKSVMLANVTASPVTGCKLFIGGTAAANQVTGTFTLPANGTALFTGESFSVFDSTGALIFVSPLNAADLLTAIKTVDGAGSGLDADLLDGISSAGFDAAGAAAAAQAASQPLDTTLTNLAAQNWALNAAPIGTGADTVTQQTIAANQFLGRSSTGNYGVKSMTDAGFAFAAAADAAAEMALLPDATSALPGRETAAQWKELNALEGRTTAGASPRIFRPSTFAGTYDPTGASDSTPSFQAMMTAYNAFNDRAMIELNPGVFKVDPGVFTGFGTAPLAIKGPNKGVCVLIPNNSTADFITLGSGSDGNLLEGFAIYNTGSVFTTGAGINTNDADSISIYDMMFVNLFYDIRVNGRPVASTTNGTTTISGISPVLTAGDVGKSFNGVGIPAGSTIQSQTGSGCVLNNAATVSTSATRYVGDTIKCSIQRTFHSQTNGSATSVGIRVENGDAGDTYIGPDIVMSNTGATRRRASVELVASGHYEITQANLTGAAQGILMTPQQSQNVAFGFHTNVLCDSCTINGMSVTAPTATSTVKNVKSVNSWYSGTTSGAGLSGVVTSGTAGGVINGFTFTTDRFLNNQRHGFDHGFGTDFRWSDCDMKGNNAVNAAIGTGYDGLSVAAAVSNWSINGGKFGGTDTVVTSPNQRYGINVIAGAGDNIKVSADDLSGNRDGPLQFGATGANCFINGCPGLAPSKTLGASQTIANTNTAVVAITLPKNSSRIGTTVSFIGGGFMSNSTAASTPFFRIYANTASLGAIIGASWSAPLGTTARTTIPFSFHGGLTIKSLGAGGTCLGYMDVNINNAVVPILVVVPPTTAQAIDTTADKLIEFAVVSGAATTTFVFTTIRADVLY